MEKVAIDDCTNTLLRIFNEAKTTGQKVDEEFINSTINQFRIMLPQYKVFNEEDWKAVKFKIETSINVEIDEHPIILSNPNVERWLDHKRGELEWSYWKAYREFLIDQGRALSVIKETETTIDEILDCSGDPSIEGHWKRRGLVMGNVQSGKTQNYLGLINKAIDAGYKVIIVLGGHLNELRTQTQERLDEGVIDSWNWLGVGDKEVFENYPDYQKEWVKGRMMFKHYSNISLLKKNSIGYLSMDIKDGWEKLCGYLSHAIPGVDFPYIK